MYDLAKFIPPIHPEGYQYVGIFIGLAVISYLFFPNMFWVCILASLCCAAFFRDPERVSPDDPLAILSAADGIITSITTMLPPSELGFTSDEPVTRVSTFLSIFDAHVNRIPIAGTITATHYHAGAFISATLDKSSDENERQLLTIETKNKTKIGVVQIAGLIARRIICTSHVGDNVYAGQRYGIIRFGSRVDLYIPHHLTIKVKIGQKMVAGETVIALLQ